MAEKALYIAQDPLFIEKVEAADNHVFMCAGIGCESLQVLTPGTVPSKMLADATESVRWEARDTAKVALEQGRYLCPTCFMKRLEQRVAAKAARAAAPAKPAPAKAVAAEDIKF